MLADLSGCFFVVVICVAEVLLVNLCVLNAHSRPQNNNDAVIQMRTVQTEWQNRVSWWDCLALVGPQSCWEDIHAFECEFRRPRHDDAEMMWRPTLHTASHKKHNSSAAIATFALQIGPETLLPQSAYQIEHCRCLAFAYSAYWRASETRACTCPKQTLMIQRVRFSVCELATLHHRFVPTALLVCTEHINFVDVDFSLQPPPSPKRRITHAAHMPVRMSDTRRRRRRTRMRMRCIVAGAEDEGGLSSDF